jgi:hypothetical protein
MLAFLSGYGTFKSTVPVAPGILWNEADQNGSFYYFDNSEKVLYPKFSEPAAPLLACVIRRVFFYLEA